MRNLKFIVAYDGTNYHGFQRQINAVTVQGKIEKALKKLVKRDIEIIGASRTDAGVHAEGQVFNCQVNSSIPTKKFPIALNTKLPDDIVVVDTCEVSKKFHARYHTQDKTYYYQIYNNKLASPFLRNYAYHVPYNLNLSAIKEASKYLIGKHDFSSFRSAKCGAKTAVRNILDMNIRSDNDLIIIKIRGTGFLYNMVRIIIGTLVDVGSGKIEANDIKQILMARNRRLAGKTAPAHGLVLQKIRY